MLNIGANLQDIFLVHIGKEDWSWDWQYSVCVLLSGGSEGTLYQRNEKLDKKISLYSGDITKLEIDAIVNAGKWMRVFCL